MSVGAPRLNLLAQAAENLFGQLLPWLIMLVGVVVVGGGAIHLVRRMLQSGPSASDESFTLYELRQMREAGRLSDEEFERAKALIIGRAVNQPSAGTEIGRQTDERDSRV